MSAYQCDLQVYVKAVRPKQEDTIKIDELYQLMRKHKMSIDHNKNIWIDGRNVAQFHQLIAGKTITG